jgi:hypothetical protein
MSDSTAQTQTPRWIIGAWMMFFFILLGWFCKIGFFLGLQRDQNEYAIITWNDFPDHAVLPAFGWMMFWLPIITPLLLIIKKRATLVISSVILIIASLGTSTSISFHNDATFVMSFWASLWLLCWCLTAKDDRRTWRWPIRLAIVTVSFFFLGGFVGKLTPDYWSGQAFHTLYFIKKNYFIYNYLRTHCEPETLVTMAKWFSRTAVLGEGFLALGFWLPVRLYAPIALVIMIGMVIISTPYLTSVMSAPIGLAAVAWWLQHALDSQRVSPRGVSSAETETA